MNLTLLMLQSRMPPSSCELSVRSCRGQSGQGVEAARSSGGLGMISNWWTLFAPWRWLVPRQSAPVSPPPMMRTRLPVARMAPAAASIAEALLRVAFVAAILLGQELHGEVNALELAAGDGQVARMLGAAAEQDGVEVLGERFDGDVDADVRVGLEDDALGLHLLDAAIDDVLFQLEVGNAVAEQAADAVVLSHRR